VAALQSSGITLLQLLTHIIKTISNNNDININIGTISIYRDTDLKWLYCNEVLKNG